MVDRSTQHLMRDNRFRGARIAPFRFDRMHAHMHRFLRMTGIPELYYRMLVSIRWMLRGKHSGQRHRRNAELIVSLTSFPSRFSVLYLTLRSLLAQSVVPDRLILWLYAPDAALLPENVRSLVGQGLEIRELKQDIKSYKKLIPALVEFPDAYIVTADDDLYYPRFWLQRLIDAHKPSDRCVTGCRAHIVKHRADGTIAPYGEWGWEVRKECQGADVFLTGGAGVLYPPGALPLEALNSSTFMALCPTADDVWTNYMFRLNGFSARKIAYTHTVYDWLGTRENALGKGNVIGSGNDDALGCMAARYGDVFHAGGEH